MQFLQTRYKKIMTFLYTKFLITTGIYLSTLIVLTLWVNFSAQAFEPMNIPPLADFVVDHAGVLSSGDLQLLNQQWQNIQLQTTAQIATVLIPTQWDYQLLDIGLKLFRETALGQKDKDNGVLLVINTEQKKMRIIVGYGLEWAVPDIAARDLIETTIRPLVNSGLYLQAIQSYYNWVVALIKDDGTSRVENNQESIEQLGMIDLIAWWVWFLLFVTMVWYVNKKNKIYEGIYRYLHNKGSVQKESTLYVGLFLLWGVSLFVLTKLLFVWWTLWSLWGMYLGNIIGWILYGKKSRWWGGFSLWWWGFGWGWGFSWWFSWWWGSSGWWWAGD